MNTVTITHDNVVYNQFDYTKLVEKLGETVVDNALALQHQDDIIEQRVHAYITESDPLFIESQFDKTDESIKKWRDKVNEIKARYPFNKPFLK